MMEMRRGLEKSLRDLRKVDEEEVPLAKGGGKGGCIGAIDGDEEGAGEELGKVG